MPEYSNYLESLDPVVGALSGDEIIGASKDGDAVSLTAQQIADLGGGGGTWGSITGTLADQTDLNTALVLKAPLDSPDLTGTPTVPTAAAGTNTTQAASTAFVQAAVANSKTLPIKCTDDVTPIGVATVFTFRMPYAMTLTGIRAGLTTAQASGSIFTVDVREAGVTILSTLITIDNTEKTSVTAATPPVISDASLADDAEITILVTQIGNGSAIGLQVTFIG